MDYRTGREVVKWDYDWFSGIYTLGFSTNLSTGSLHIKNFNFSSSKDVKILRGKVYGAVKYNDEWRACIIETK